MAEQGEDVVVVEGDEVTPEGVGIETKEDALKLADVEEIARKMGWSEKDKFGGNPDKFIDAVEYVKRTPNRNQLLSRQLKDMTNVVSELKRHNERVYKAEVSKLTREIEELKTQRKDAIKDGDIEKVEAIEQQIVNIRDSAPARPEPESEAPSPDFTVWLEDNSWYHENAEMKKFADDAGLVYKGKIPYPEILKKVRKLMEVEYPEKFSKKKKELPGASVEGASRSVNTKKMFSKTDLNESQRGIMKQFVRANVMTEAEYIADLVKQGELS
jgi:hypothetical protein